MKFIVNLFVVFFCFICLQASDSTAKMNSLSRSTELPVSVDEQISQHLVDMELRRKEVLLRSAQALTITSQKKVTRGILKDVCRELQPVLLKTVEDKSISSNIGLIQQRFFITRGSSFYGCIPCWKNYSNNRIRQEATRLREAINISLFLIKTTNDTLEDHEVLLVEAQAFSAPIARPMRYNPEFIEVKNNN